MVLYQLDNSLPPIQEPEVFSNVADGDPESVLADGSQSIAVFGPLGDIEPHRCQHVSLRTVTHLQLAPHHILQTERAVQPQQIGALDAPEVVQGENPADLGCVSRVECRGVLRGLRPAKGSPSFQMIICDGPSAPGTLWTFKGIRG